jgi:hypothetical protein
MPDWVRVGMNPSSTLKIQTPLEKKEKGHE